MTARDAAATRQRILEHAQRQFAAHGYAGVTVKGVADAAGVSPNLITRYFGGKDGLFLAATQVEIRVEDSFDGDRSSLGSRLAAGIVARWFGLPGEDPLLVLLRASGERPEAAEALASFLDRSSLQPLCRYLRDSGLDEAQARDRAAAIDAFMLGVSARRRVLRSELGDPAELQAWLSATIQRLADGLLGRGGPGRRRSQLPRAGHEGDRVFHRGRLRADHAAPAPTGSRCWWQPSAASPACRPPWPSAMRTLPKPFQTRPAASAGLPRIRRRPEWLCLPA